MVTHRELANSKAMSQSYHFNGNVETIKEMNNAYKIILPTDSWQETYGLKTLFPEDWSELIYRMKANDTLFQTFHR